MLTPEQFVRALALTESNDNPEAWGDAGRAMGRWQVHPDWVWTWANKYALEPALNETWDSFIHRLVTAFANEHLSIGNSTQVAMHFHLGHRSNSLAFDWDADYAQRFAVCEDRVANA